MAPLSNWNISRLSATIKKLQNQTICNTEFHLAFIMQPQKDIHCLKTTAFEKFLFMCLVSRITFWLSDTLNRLTRDGNADSA